jgi:hypothetical protein
MNLNLDELAAPKPRSFAPKGGRGGRGQKARDAAGAEQAAVALPTAEELSSAALVAADGQADHQVSQPGINEEADASRSQAAQQPGTQPSAPINVWDAASDEDDPLAAALAAAAALPDVPDAAAATSAFGVGQASGRELAAGRAEQDVEPAVHVESAAASRSQRLDRFSPQEGRQAAGPQEAPVSSPAAGLDSTGALLSGLEALPRQQRRVAPSAVRRRKPEPVAFSAPAQPDSVTGRSGEGAVGSQDRPVQHQGVSPAFVEPPFQSQLPNLVAAAALTQPTQPSSFVPNSQASASTLPDEGPRPPVAASIGPQPVALPAGPDPANSAARAPEPAAGPSPGPSSEAAAPGGLAGGLESLSRLPRRAVPVAPQRRRQAEPSSAGAPAVRPQEPAVGGSAPAQPSGGVSTAVAEERSAEPAGKATEPSSSEVGPEVATRPRPFSAAQDITGVAASSSVSAVQLHSAGTQGCGLGSCARS